MHQREALVLKQLCSKIDFENTQFSWVGGRKELEWQNTEFSSVGGRKEQETSSECLSDVIKTSCIKREALDLESPKIQIKDAFYGLGKGIGYRYSV